MRLSEFLTFKFSPWTSVCVSEELVGKVKSELPDKAKQYKKEMQQMEAMKHIEEIREKLEAIDTFRKKQKEMKEVVEQEEKEREKLFAKKEEWMDV